MTAVSGTCYCVGRRTAACYCRPRRKSLDREAQELKIRSPLRPARWLGRRRAPRGPAANWLVSSMRGAGSLAFGGGGFSGVGRTLAHEEPIHVRERGQQRDQPGLRRRTGDRMLAAIHDVRRPKSAADGNGAVAVDITRWCCTDGHTGPSVPPPRPKPA
jgi:hypothetical protein